MSSKINLKNMKEVFGSRDIWNFIWKYRKKLQYLNELKFDDSIGLLERCPELFINFPKDFKRKIDNLIQKLGEDYVEKIQNDVKTITRNYRLYSRKLWKRVFNAISCI